jgi:glycogen operon protein
MRAFWIGREGMLPELAARLMGSADKFNWGGRRPWSSINFITAHDGFTLHDVVSYNDKHNEANGEDNRDGTSDNHSWNHGVEGETENQDIIELRERQKRNMLASLLFSQGLPMLLAGDELGRTQRGNNNAYCQDNDISWLKWDLDERQKALARFVRKLLSLRRSLPVLRRERFLTGAYNEELDIKELTWLAPNGDEMSEEHWHNPHGKCLGVVIDGRAQPTGIRRRGMDRSVLLIFNAHPEVVKFRLHDAAGGAGWELLVDTNQPELGIPPIFNAGDIYEVTGRSLLLFELVIE